MYHVRTLNAADLPAVLALKNAEGWNQTARDFEILLELAPSTCFAIDGDDKVAATTTALPFGRDLAWIGMVMTDPAYRRRGLARRLMEHALQHLDEQGIGWVKLDATGMGRGLYESLGFREECAVERWMRPVTPCATGPLRAAGFRPDPELDRAAFGADRSRLLDALASLGAWSVPGAGFAMGRGGALGPYFGPCVSRPPAAAGDLLQAFLERHPRQSVYWDILPANHAAVDLAREYGFIRSRELVRMARPGPAGTPPVAQDPSLIFAIAGFEFG